MTNTRIKHRRTSRFLMPHAIFSDNVDQKIVLNSMLVGWSTFSHIKKETFQNQRRSPVCQAVLLSLFGSNTGKNRWRAKTRFFTRRSENSKKNAGDPKLAQTDSNEPVSERIWTHFKKVEISKLFAKPRVLSHLCPAAFSKNGSGEPNTSEIYGCLSLGARFLTPFGPKKS